MNRNYSVFLMNVGGCSDRYCPEYDRPYDTEELFERVASIDLISGVDLVGTRALLKEKETVQRCLAETGLKPVSVAVDHFTLAKYRQGSFSSVDPAIRREAVDATRQVMDYAADIGCGIVTIWPGQDGFDYPFQADYLRERDWFAEGIKEACAHRPDMMVTLEYKMKEPRTHSYLSTAAVTALVLQEIDEPNCGAVLDFGHSLLGYESPAESVALFKKYGDRLKHIHMNDNYRSWDDDMIVGSVRSIEYLEFFYWLRRTGYDGWFTMDQFPYRENGRDAVEESARWMNSLESLMDEADPDEIADVLRRKDGVAASRLARKLLLGGAKTNA